MKKLRTALIIWILVYTQIILSGEQDKIAVEEFLSNHVSGFDTDLNLDGNISFRLMGMSDFINITINQTITLNGLADDLIKPIFLNSLEITISLPSTFIITANMDATIANPFNFAINVTHLDYEVYFDDADGCYIPPVGPNYAPENHIFITYIDNSSSVEINANSEQILQESVNINNKELAFRLNDEKNKGNLKIDITNGIMHVLIGEFSIEIEFSFSKIPVS